MTNGNVCVAVNEMLEEIQQLNVERLSKSSTTKTCAIQCEIFRKFAIIEYLLTSNDWDATQKSAIMETVASKKKDCKAEAEDLKTMKIPRVPKKITVDDSLLQNEFPHFLELPKEVQEIILSNIESPQDKLNILKAMPLTSTLMNWDKTAIKFEQVLPILLKCRVLMLDEIETISKVKSSFESLVINFFLDRVLTLSKLSVPEVSTNKLIYHPGTTPSLAGISLPVIPARLAVSGKGLNGNFQPNDILNILQQIGTKLCDCSINGYSLSELQATEFISQCFALTANLKRVSVFVTSSIMDQIVIDDNDLLLEFLHRMPDLPQLKIFMLGQDGPFHYTRLTNLLLNKYGSGLEQLQITNFCAIREYQPMAFPNLFRLNISGTAEVVNLQDYVDQLAMFRGCSLKYLQISGGDCFNHSPVLATLWRAISGFASTLEEIRLDIGKCYLGPGWRLALNLDANWISGICFPKVKKLAIGWYPENWSFILLFPYIENLIFCNPFKANVVDQPGSLHLLNKKNILESSIWKMLSHLRSIQFKTEDNFLAVRKCIVTRRDCIDYQDQVGNVNDPNFDHSNNRN